MSLLLSQQIREAAWMPFRLENLEKFWGTLTGPLNLGDI